MGAVAVVAVNGWHDGEDEEVGSTAALEAVLSATPPERQLLIFKYRFGVGDTPR